MTQTVEQSKLGRWKHLIEIPEVIPSASFIEGDGAIDFVKEYTALVDNDYKGNEYLKVYSVENDLVLGSNPFAVVLTQRMFRPQGIRVATQADLELAVKTGALNLQGTYEDSALVLRSAGDRDWADNHYVANNLAEQVKARNAQLGKLRVPVVISLNSLDVTNDASSNYGLAFTLREHAELIEAPILKEGGKFSTRDIDTQTGLPRQLNKEGNRTLYARANGLSGLCLDWDLDLNSSDRSLADSLSDGRVVLVRGEAARADLADKLNSNMQAQRSELLARHNEDIAVLDRKLAAATKAYEETK